MDRLGLVGLRHRRHGKPVALTYARRNALFTLVGIAGKGDLDAPDLATPTNRESGPREAALNGGHNGSARRAGGPKAAEPVFAPEANYAIGSSPN